MRRGRVTMRTIRAAVVMTAWVAAAGAQVLTVESVVESLAVRYDRITTYHADADVFEYSG